MIIFDRLSFAIGQCRLLIYERASVAQVAWLR